MTSRSKCSLLLVVGVVFVLGCGGTERSRGIRVAFDDTPMSLDPHLQNHSVTWSVLCNIYDPLVTFSPEMELEPALAVRWEWAAADRLVMELRRGVRFHDGAAFTSEDVVASFERGRDHARSLIRHYLVGIESLEAAGPYEIVITTSGPAPNLLNRLPFLLIVDTSAATVEEISQPRGTGSYRFAGTRPDGSIELEGVPGWHGRPDIRRALLSFWENSTAAAAELLAGRADVAVRLPDDLIFQVSGARRLRAVPQPRLAVQLLAVAPGAAAGEAGRALRDERVRRALLYALDRASWVDRVFRGNATVASQYVHPVVFGYDPGIAVVPYDVAEARRLLAEAGFADGFEVAVGHGFVGSGVVEAIVEDLAQVGITAVPRAAEFGELLDLAREGRVPLFLYAWACSTGDASDFLSSSLHTQDAASGYGAENYTGFSDAEVNRLIEESEREGDQEQRRLLLQNAQHRALESFPLMPLTIRWGYLGVTDAVDVVPRHDSRVMLAPWRWRRGG